MRFINLVALSILVLQPKSRHISVTAGPRQDTTEDGEDKRNLNGSIYVEAMWDQLNNTNVEAVVQAGEMVTFVCRIWRAPSGELVGMDRITTDSTADQKQAEQSVFLYCPLSVAYCAQDCMLVDRNWPISCTRQYRKLHQHHTSAVTIRLPEVDQWEVQEVFYSMSIAVIGSSGPWSCSYGGLHSISLGLRVRDRPVLLSLTAYPSSPVLTGTAVNLTCQAAPSPNAPWYNFIWRRTGSHIPPAHSTIRLSDTVSVLTLWSAQPSDDGSYSCHVMRDADNARLNWWHTDRGSLSVVRTEHDDPTSNSDTSTPAVLHIKLDVHRKHSERSWLSLNYSLQSD
ncbi:hypothetical protein EG68_06675 [Paragonimus skrjabini miyazakii]|uniref:Ig-like domain-containing protein n=1 Tax=Paragonimus skrjabini miyazakii TaxID=59628 RepID=A0A8S9YP60_9TREM|nr:hypothetical protein EG68_06675 [Paragonimus skrjabini miyazakii]